ncbi:MAG: inorganic diphosphatase [Deltaproteobacteria bacterium]|nr:inorganic diphosphatase [Deltaproteobacteria bacterium]
MSAGARPARHEVQIEVPRGGFVKRGPDGVVQLRSPLPCPFAYGSVVGTRAADGDAVDAVLLGRALPAGARCSALLVGKVEFIDNGVPDDKYVFWAGEGAGPNQAEQRLVEAFFALYALVKGTRARLRGRRGPTRAGPSCWSGVQLPAR